MDNLPDDLESLKRLLAVERAARIDAETKAASAEAAAARATAHVSSAEALIAHFKLAIEKMRRELYGSRSERRRKLLDQMELELEDLEAAAAEDEIAAEKATAEAGGASLADMSTGLSSSLIRTPMERRQIMCTASPASLWRLRVAYLIVES